MMESPDHPVPAASPVLSYLTDQTYRPTGELGLGVATTILSGGLLAAAASALITFFWFRAHLPTPFFLPFLVQASVVAFPLAWLIRRLKVNNLRFAIATAVVSGVSCVVFFYFTQYVHNVFLFREAMHLRWTPRNGSVAGSVGGTNVLIEVDAHPFRVFDRRVVFPRAHVHGFAGYLIIRGQRVWVIGAFQALLIAWVAAKRGSKAAGRPLCSHCRTWFADPINGAVVPVEEANSLGAAIENEDLAQLVHYNQIMDTPLGSACTVARIHTCPSCGRNLAEVVTMTFGRRNRERIVLPPRQISSEAADALRGRLNPVQPLELSDAPNV